MTSQIYHLRDSVDSDAVSFLHCKRLLCYTLITDRSFIIVTAGEYLSEDEFR